MSRTAQLQRTTTETAIDLTLNLDGQGARPNRTPASAFWITCWICSAGMRALDLSVQAQGDLHVDQHHTVEDVGICLGQALRAGVRRQAGHSPLRPFHAADGRDAGDVGAGSERTSRSWSSRRNSHRPRSVNSTANWCGNSGRLRRQRPAEPAHRPAPWREQPPHQRGHLQGHRTGPPAAVELDPRMTGVPSTKGTLGCTWRLDTRVFTRR